MNPESPTNAPPFGTLKTLRKLPMPGYGYEDVPICQNRGARKLCDRARAEWCCQEKNEPRRRDRPASVRHCHAPKPT